MQTIANRVKHITRHATLICYRSGIAELPSGDIVTFPKGIILRESKDSIGRVSRKIVQFADDSIIDTMEDI